MEHLVSEHNYPFGDINVLILILGYVFEAYDNTNKCKVALKRTQKAGNIVSREYEVLSKMKGKPNVV